MIKTPDQVFDELLVLRYRSGDRQAMNLLIKRWHQRIKKQVTRYTYEPEVAEDLAQEVWEVILKGVNHLREPALFGIWAQRIASRRAVDWIRKNQRERKLYAEVAMENPFEEFSSDEMISQLRKGLRILPDDQRMILIHFYLERNSVNEIAAILEIPQGTVKSRLFHARQKLKDILTIEQNEN
jgi:RNA polymerase sigma factor (sigma-70 family)